jgi:hypothetical protein
VIVRISRARIRPNNEKAAFEILREATAAAPRLPSLDLLLEDSSVEHYETIVETYDSLKKIGV